MNEPSWGLRTRLYLELNSGNKSNNCWLQEVDRIRLFHPHVCMRSFAESTTPFSRPLAICLSKTSDSSIVDWNWEPSFLLALCNATWFLPGSNQCSLSSIPKKQTSPVHSMPCKRDSTSPSDEIGRNVVFKLDSALWKRSVATRHPEKAFFLRLSFPNAISCAFWQLNHREKLWTDR